LRYDQNGFRNDRDLPHAEIAVIGDSYVESQMIPGPMLATTRLSEMTLQTVANLGQSGFGPQQELAVLKRYALPLRPRFIVWVFYEGNDLADAREYSEMVSLLKAKADSIEFVWNRSFTKNFLSWFLTAIHGCVPGQKVSGVPATVIDKDGREHRLYVKGRSISPSLTKQDLDALKKSVEAIKEAYRLAEQEGARFIVVFAPTAFRVYRDIARFEKEGRNAPPWSLDDLPDRLRQMVSKISPEIDYLDLTPALKSAAKNGPIFLYDDTHWSTEGHQVVAEALAGAITAEPMMEAGMQSPEMQRAKENLVLSHNAIMIRNADGTIRYWSKGAQELYGWKPDHALGMTSHRLLETVFPVPLDVIEEELRVKGYWEGRLIHRRLDGSKITVTSHWNLQQDPTSPDQSITVIEINGPSKS
jgi:PAS domain S-box-containing protein